MKRWEYMTTLVYADVNNPGAKKHWQSIYRGNVDPPRYAVESLMPQLNAWGDEGWELIHMQPVAGVGNKGDIHFQGASYTYSNAYFCAFKRQIGE